MDTAIVQAKKTQLWLWFLPLATLFVIIGLVVESWQQQGTVIQIQFSHGYGLKAGDELRYRGISVGKVEKVVLFDQTLEQIQVTVRLHTQAESLASQGSLFWIVRPKLSLDSVKGLDTLLGNKYLAVIPGQGEPKTLFIGLEQPPLLEVMEQGGLTIILQAKRLGGLQSGSQIYYRQIPIGTVLSVALASDASAIEAKAYISPQYSYLIREHNQFWQVSGFQLEAGLTGFSLELDSLQGLIQGGIEMAIPPQAGQAISEQHRFFIHPQAKKEWLEWQPNLISPQQLQLPKNLPQPQAVNLSWRYRNYAFLKKSRQRQGWVLADEKGFIGLADLLTIPDDAIEDSVNLEINQQMIPLSQHFKQQQIIAIPAQASFPSKFKSRITTTPEDTLILADPNKPLKAVSATRYTPKEQVWWLDPTLKFSNAWHGASVLSRQDGAVLGFLSLSQEPAMVILFTEAKIEQ